MCYHQMMSPAIDDSVPERGEVESSIKKLKNGHVSSLTEARREIEALWRDKTPPCVTLVREKFNRYEALWKNFVLKHDKLMEFVDVTEQGQISEQFNILAQQRINLAASVEEFICNAATELNECVMQDLQELTKSSRRRSRGSRSRRSSISRSSSKTQALRLEAEKAWRTLAFAEEENQRKVEAEIKILELERKQRELLRRREVEEGQLKDTIRLESLKTEADSNLAEARKRAAIMELEAKIAESSDNETTSMELTPVDNALPSRSSTFNPPLTTVNTPALSSTPKASTSSAHTPAQRFNRIVMLREDMDDDNKMARLLQFLDGEAKQVASGLETVTGGVHQALQILEQRYGRPCMIVSSVVTNLVKGPPISNSDKVALRKFADCATMALATLKSMNCLSQINQGNIVSMTERLPKPFQDKFAALAFDLETKGQHFPTLTNFVDFVNKHASIANHPVSGKPQHFSYNNPLRNKRELPNGKSDLPKFTMSISNHGKQSVQPSWPPQKNAKGKSNNCCCCGQAHPLYRCRIEGCGAFHPSLLHPTQLHISASEKTSSVDSASAVSNTACTTTGTEDPGTILLQVVPLRVIGADGLVVTTYAMLDSGSEITLVDPSLVSSLRLSGQPGRLVLSTVSSREPQEGERVDLVVESVIDEQPQRLQLKGVWSGKELNIPLRHQGITRDKAKWPHLQDVPFPEVARQKVSLIIGTNVPEVFIPLEVRCGNPSDPIATRLCLGFAVLGRTGDSSAQQCYDVHYIHTATDDISLNYQVERFWELESFGSTKPYTSMSVEDKCAEQIIHSTFSKANNHYCMGLLWKNDQPSLPFNRAMAKIRFHHLNPNKPGKIRVVFDAAAKFHGTSLNDQFLQGPNYINNLAGVLMRFRQEEVVLVADRADVPPGTSSSGGLRCHSVPVVPQR
ncbi:uncharacterized protein [Montipora foliosa]|uniref:uncharacterized protein n=1 Tax=Montipora foliosa TaxID=591990 RepID=UPI0035F14B20